MKSFKEFLSEDKIKPIKRDEVIRLIKKYIKEFLETFKNEQDNYEDWVDTILTYQVKVREFNSFIELNIVSSFEKKKELTDLLTTKISKLGWFSTSIDYDYKTRRTTIHFAPNYGEELKSIPEFMYHASPSNYEKKILSGGLKPTTPLATKHGFTYPASVFLSLTLQDCLDLIHELRHGGLDFGERASDTKYCVFKIDTSKVNRNTKYYIDPQVKDRSAVYTYTHIPANAITKPSLPLSTGVYQLSNV